VADNNTPASIIPYEVVFALLMALVAFLPGQKLAAVSRLLILIFIIFASIASIYYLSLRKDTWQTSSLEDTTVSDTTRYVRAARRSSAIYIALNVILFIGAKILGLSYNGVWYNYISLLVTTMITYVYDRAISTDDGLSHFKVQPLRTIWYAYLSICSPSFMRYLIAICCELSLMILVAYYIGQLIPAECKLISTIFRKSIAPIVIYTIVGGPLRFMWAYPTVTEAFRISYLTAYIICFTVLSMILYASGKIEPSTAAGVLVLMGLIAMILQSGGLSNARHTPDVFNDATVMPEWIMAILATLILISVLVISYKIFVDFLRPYILVTTNPEGENKARRKAEESQQQTYFGLTSFP
jgi:hypothetical protein